MMTWKERKVFVFDQTLSRVNREYQMPNEIREGWGMTHFKDLNGKNVILVSDGSN